METKDKIEFEISGEQLKNVKKFRKQHKNCVMGTAEKKTKEHHVDELTEEEKRNSEFEETAKRILYLRSPQYFRIAFRQAITFDVLYAYAAGLSVNADRRIRESILHKYDLDKYHSEIYNYKDCDEPKKIEKFFKHFMKSVKKEVSKYDCKDQRLLQYLSDNTVYDYKEV